MKSIPALILLFGFTWTQFYNSAVLGIYELNKTEYIQAFCENQEKPELKCNGKCHLSKQLLDTQKESNKNEPPTLLTQQELFVYHIEEPKSFQTNSKRTIFFNSNPYYFHYLDRIDHPPRV